MPVITVTLGSGATQISPHGIGYRQLIVQNSGSGSMYLGGSTVSSSTGIAIAAGATGPIEGPSPVQLDLLSNKYIAGTSGQVAIVDYLPA